jgi:hypothetical protein
MPNLESLSFCFAESSVGSHKVGLSAEFRQKMSLSQAGSVLQKDSIVFPVVFNVFAGFAAVDTAVSVVKSVFCVWPVTMINIITHFNSDD